MSVDTIRDIPVIVEHRRGGCNADFDPMDFDHYDDYDSGFPFDNTSRRTRDPLEDIAQRHPEFAQHLQGFPRRTQRTAGDRDEDEFLRRRFERPFSSGRFERFGFPFDRDDFEREPQRYYEAYPEHFENFQNQHPQSPSSSSSHTQPQQQQQQYQQSSSQTPPQGYQQYPPQYSQQYQPQPETQKPSQQQYPPQYQSQASGQSVSQGTQTECDSAEGPAPQQSEQHQTDGGGSQDQQQKVDGGQQTRGRPIQQSNTCDLAQHQPPDEALNERGQRSMSAPPENNNKRFTSSVNIPMGGHQEAAAAGGAKSQASSGSTERVIPIHVEGRDDPVIPKHFSSGSSQTHHQQQPQAERIFSESPRSQPETIFGRRPEAFTQFVNREPHRFPSNDWPSSFGSFPEDDFGFPRQTESPSRFSGAPRQQQHHQQPQRQETASQAHVQKPQEQQKPCSEPEATQQPPQPQQHQQAPKQPQGPIEQIQAIQKDVSNLLRQVEAFSGAPKDKNYLWLDEMLTRNLLKLDNVETHGQDGIRSARKEAIKCIEKTIGLLEAKAAANVAPKGDSVEQQQQPQENMDTEASSSVSQDASSAVVSRSASQKEDVVPQESSDKIVDQQVHSKSGEAVENAEGQIIKEVNSEETQKVDEVVVDQAEGGAVKDSGEAATTAEVKEGEKKEKKKIKKKVNKEEKK